MSSPSQSPYIVGPVYDWVFFLLPPTLALGVGVAISGSDFSNRILIVGGFDTTLAEISLGALIHAHLVAVIFRSHLNPEIRKLHPIRFLLIPVVVLFAAAYSGWGMAIATVVATFWDVWHSGAQTFGFARIYDRNAGNPAGEGRRLDYALQQLLYAGPILAGVTLVDHVDSFEAFENVHGWLFTSAPARIMAAQPMIIAGVVGGGALFLIYYVFAYLRLIRRGYRLSIPKVFLVVTTGACSIYCWTFDSWGEAFFIMNLFHAIQYLGLVWATEGQRIRLRLGLLDGRVARLSAMVFFLGTIFAYGLWAQLLDTSNDLLWAVTIVVSLMHFWYDGFIWSVRRAQV